MTPLHVALIVKNTPASFERDTRNMGLFSYEVPEFTWEHIAPGKGTTIDTLELKIRGFDLIFHEDGGAWCEYVDDAIPIAYYAIDSTLSNEFHFKPRFEQARKADLVLVDHDRLERFEPCGKPVHRLSYCVNEKLFHSADKTLDVCFHCGGSAERGSMRVRLSELCKREGMSYVSGAVSLKEYACDMNRAKVVVNIPRTPTNRPHRLFDGMASGAAVVTLPVPDVGDEPRRAGLHYMEVTDDLLEERVLTLVKNGTWELIGIAGQELVQEKHTWAVRAKQLRELIQCELSV